jgi:hypothetical protein
MSRVIAPSSEIGEFEKRIDQWVIRRVLDGETDFSQLVVSLPGVYPASVVDSLRRQLHDHRHIRTMLTQIEHSRDTSLPLDYNPTTRVEMTHPLDYDWRFSRQTTGVLLEECIRLSHSQDKIVFLGAPSLFASSTRDARDRRFVLIDKNPVHKKLESKDASFVCCDLLKKCSSNLKGRVILADPPWYPEFQMAFIWHASHMCQIGGKVMLIVPGIGTRPTIQREWQSLLDWAYKFGLSYSGLAPITVSYDTPYFEHNALRHEGITLPLTSWRRADLAIFSKERRNGIKQPLLVSRNDWSSRSFFGIKIRKSNSKGFIDPTLVSLVDGDVLTSVSRRDPRRQSADVWTSGNRVFACKGTNILAIILRNMPSNSQILKEIESYIGRKPTTLESRQVARTVRNVTSLISKEGMELMGVPS